MAFCVEHFDEYLNIGQCTHLKLEELPSLFIEYNFISKFLDFIHYMVFDFIFYYVSMNTLSCTPGNPEARDNCCLFGSLNLESAITVNLETVTKTKTLETKTLEPVLVAS